MKKFLIIIVFILGFIFSFLCGVGFTIKNIRPLDQAKEVTEIEFLNHIFSYEN